MKCDKRDVPTYLQTLQKKTFQEKDFFYFHKAYRLKTQGNQIEIPENWLTAISCRWSRLIKRSDVLLELDLDYSKTLQDDFSFSFVNEIKNYKRVSQFNEQHEFAGTHILSCVLQHTPLACNYAHCEIYIRHQIFREDENKPFFDQTYSYESWENKTALLKKSKAKFFKELRRNWRIDMMNLISRNSESNTIGLQALACLRFLKKRSAVSS